MNSQSIAKRFMRHMIHKTSIAVISSCEIMRRGFYSTLLETRRFEQVHIFKNESAISRDFIQNENIGVVIIDDDSFSSRQMACFSVARISQFKGTTVMVMSSTNNVVQAAEYLRAGARSYIWRGSSLSDFNEALNKVRRGEYWLDAAVNEYYQKVLAQKKDEPLTVAEKVFMALTHTQQTVISHYMSGLTVSEIALRSKRSVKTISGHKQAAMKRLGVSNQVELLTRYGHLRQE